MRAFVSDGRPLRRWVLMLLLGVAGLLGACQATGAAAGPLRVSARNPRYFEDPQGHIVYLTGAHTWATLEDQGFADPPEVTDFSGYLDLLARHNMNFIRLWTGENFTYNEGKNIGYAQPLPYPRTGPGEALDGKPKFDLSRYDPEYFRRLRARCIAAQKRGMYVSVMLFEGWQCAWGAGKAYNYKWAYAGNPYHPANNINGIDPGSAIAVHTMDVPAVVAMEEAYVRHVVDTVNDLDNVLYEISNESNQATATWQYHMIDVVRNYEKSKPKQHPIGMTDLAEPGGKPSLAYLLRSKADWISPGIGGTDADYYTDTAPGADGAKVSIPDTDHMQAPDFLDRTQMLWKTATRGMNFLYMDVLDNDETREPARAAVRKNMGMARSCMQQMDLTDAVPRNALASTEYCLSDGKRQFLVFLPKGGEVAMNLSGASGTFSVEWIDTSQCNLVKAKPIKGGRAVILTAPFPGPAGLFLRKR